MHPEKGFNTIHTCTAGMGNSFAAVAVVGRQGSEAQKGGVSCTFLAATCSKAFSNSLNVILHIKVALLSPLQIEDILASDNSVQCCNSANHGNSDFIAKYTHLRAPLLFTWNTGRPLMINVPHRAIKDSHKTDVFLALAGL